MPYRQLLRETRAAYLASRKATVERSERNVFALYVIRPLSLLVSPLFQMIGLRPNQVTWMGFLLGIISAALFASGDWVLQVVAVFIHFGQVLLDYVDGNLARHRQESSHYGNFLEGSLDLLSLAILYPAIGWGLLRDCEANSFALTCNSAQPFPFLAGTVAALAFVATQYVTFRYERAKSEARSADVHDSIGAGPRLREPNHSRLAALRRLGRVEELVLRSAGIPFLILSTIMGWLTIFLGVFALHHLAMFVWSYANILLAGRRELQVSRS